MTSQHNSSTGSIPSAVAVVITTVSMGVSVYPMGHAPLYSACDRNWGLGMPRFHGAVRGPQVGIHGPSACADTPK